MVLFAYFQRHRLLRKHYRRVLRAFSLLEIVLVLFVLGILATAMTPAVRDIIENNRREGELRTLDELADTITASFENTDLTNLNLAALPGTVGVTETPTQFSTSTVDSPTTTANSDWFAKVARLRGITPQIGTAPTVQPELARIVFNGLGNPRLLIAAPNESGRQRFLILSLMARTDQLTLPAYETNSTWFDSIWNHDWENSTAQLPSLWPTRLTATQATAWTDGNGGLTQVHQLCVRRIVLPKYRVTVNNNHPTESAFVTFNNVPAAFTSPANSGASVTPEILGGRLVSIHRGSTAPGVESLRFHVRENTTITLQ